MEITGITSSSFAQPSVRRVLLQAVANAANVSASDVILQRITDSATGDIIYEAARRLQAAGVRVELRLKTSTAAEALAVGGTIAADVSSFSGTVLRLMQEADNATFAAANVTFNSLSYNYPPAQASSATLEMTVLAGAIAGAVVLLCAVAGAVWMCRSAAATKGKQFTSSTSGDELSREAAGADAFVIVNPMAQHRPVPLVGTAGQGGQVDGGGAQQGSQAPDTQILSAAPSVERMAADAAENTFVMVNPMTALGARSTAAFSSGASRLVPAAADAQTALVRLESAADILASGEPSSRDVSTDRVDFEPMDVVSGKQSSTSTGTESAGAGVITSTVSASNPTIVEGQTDAARTLTTKPEPRD